MFNNENEKTLYFNRLKHYLKNEFFKGIDSKELLKVYDLIPVVLDDVKKAVIVSSSLEDTIKRLESVKNKFRRILSSNKLSDTGKKYRFSRLVMDAMGVNAFRIKRKDNRILFQMKSNAESLFLRHHLARVTAKDTQGKVLSILNDKEKARIFTGTLIYNLIPANKKEKGINKNGAFKGAKGIGPHPNHELIVNLANQISSGDKAKNYNELISHLINASKMSIDRNGRKRLNFRYNNFNQYLEEASNVKETLDKLKLIPGYEKINVNEILAKLDIAYAKSLNLLRDDFLLVLNRARDSYDKIKVLEKIKFKNNNQGILKYGVIEAKANSSNNQKILCPVLYKKDRNKESISTIPQLASRNVGSDIREDLLVIGYDIFDKDLTIKELDDIQIAIDQTKVEKDANVKMLLSMYKKIKNNTYKAKDNLQIATLLNHFHSENMNKVITKSKIRHKKQELDALKNKNNVQLKPKEVRSYEPFEDTEKENKVIEAKELLGLLKLDLANYPHRPVSERKASLKHLEERFKANNLNFNATIKVLLKELTDNLETSYKEKYLLDPDYADSYLKAINELTDMYNFKYVKHGIKKVKRDDKLNKEKSKIDEEYNKKNKKLEEKLEKKYNNNYQKAEVLSEILENKFFRYVNYSKDKYEDLAKNKAEALEEENDKIRENNKLKETLLKNQNTVYSPEDMRELNTVEEELDKLPIDYFTKHPAYKDFKEDAKGTKLEEDLNQFEAYLANLKAIEEKERTQVEENRKNKVLKKQELDEEERFKTNVDLMIKYLDLPEAFIKSKPSDNYKFFRELQKERPDLYKEYLKEARIERKKEILANLEAKRLEENKGKAR